MNALGKIFKGDKRTALIKKNIVGSFAIKGWNCVIQFLIVPLSLNCLSEYEYGLWLTVNSILLGIDSVDVGLGNGLRNKLAEAMASGDLEKARTYVSTTLFTLMLIVIPLVFFLALGIESFDCYRLLNVDRSLIPNINTILILSLAFMGATFIFKFIGNLYMGLQLPAVNNALVVLGQTVSLAILYLFSYLHINDLCYVAVAFTASPLIVYLLAYPVTFNIHYKFLTPSFTFFDRGAMMELIKLGLYFFVIQISGLLLFAASNVIISNVMSPEYVTPYQIAYRYFSILFMLFSIVASPLWSATTDAYVKGDWRWINRTMKKLRIVLLFCVGVVLVMVFFAPVFYSVWINDAVEIPIVLNIMMGVYMFSMVYSNSYSYILFGIGKIRLMTIVAVCEVLLFVPVEYVTCKYFGYIGLLSSLITIMSITAVLCKIQFNKISNQTANGVWNR